MKIKSKEDFKLIRESNPTCFFFFEFLLNNENLKILSKIKNVCAKVFKNYFLNLNLTLISFENYLKFQSIFVFKSLSKKKNIYVESVDFFTSNEVILNCHLDFEKKFWIFYNKRAYPFHENFKKKVFFLYILLIEEGIIEERVIKSNYKTFKEWNCRWNDNEFDFLDDANISFSPYEIKKINEEIYLFSNFFTSVIEVCRANNQSEKKIKFKDENYLKKLTQRFVFLDKEAFDSIYDKKIEKNGENVKEKLLETTALMRSVKQERNDWNLNSQKTYVNTILKQAEFDFSKWECDTMVPFKIFVEKWLKGNFKNNNWEVLDWNDMWVAIFENEFLSKKINQIKKDEMFELLEKLKFEISEFINNNRFKVKTKKTVKIKNFVEKNKKEIICLYKNLGICEKSKEEYAIGMRIVREYETRWKSLQVTFSELLSALNLENLNKIKQGLYEKKIYNPVFFDFRGRLYVHSSTGITNFKLSRFFYHYGEYTEEEKFFLRGYEISEINNHVDVINKIKKKFSIEDEDVLIKNAVFWCILAVGKEFIDKTRTPITVREILEKGCEVFFSEKTTDSYDFEEWLIISHYSRIVSSFREKKIKKRFIHKDATASFIQNIIRILGPQSDRSLEYSNLMSVNSWYDTYSLALNFWKNELKINDGYIKVGTDLIKEDTLKLFNRKTVKKPIMVDSYEAGIRSKWDYFYDALVSEFNVEQKKRLDFDSAVYKLFKNFMSFLNNNFWNKYFLEKESDTIIIYANEIIKNKKSLLIFSKDSEADMIYYKFIEKRIEVNKILNKKKIRKSKTILVMNTSVINEKKTKISIKANWAHFSDSYLIRQIHREYGDVFLTIHDCFLVDPFSVTKFIIVSNKAFKDVEGLTLSKNKELFEKIWSIFIFF